MSTTANTALTTQGVVHFGTDYTTLPGRANTCYKTNLVTEDYDNGNDFDNQYPNYWVEG